MNDLREQFRCKFGVDARLFRAPGRVNLIGDHTDYNDGFVLPIAIDRHTDVAAAPRADRNVKAHSLNLDETISFDLDMPGHPQRRQWIDYIEGVAFALKERGVPLVGCDLLVSSSVPIGAGLSSSAALEISVALALLHCSKAILNGTSLALVGQAAEHQYVGIRSGIMDQLVSVCGLAGHALLIDCRSLEITPIPMKLGRAQIVICDSRVKHELGVSAYNERRMECESGVSIIAADTPNVRALRDVNMEQLIARRADLPPRIFQRCRHVVSEDSRTRKTAEALQAGDLSTVGKCMYASHASLRDDYEVSCTELDVLVDTAMTIEGVWGARMTGGGFGGATVNIVEQTSIEAFRKQISTVFERQFGKEPFIFEVKASQGAREL